MNKDLTVTTVKTLSSGFKHCAFTDLIAMPFCLLCCYREATNHVSGDGIIVVLRVEDGEVVSRQKLTAPGWDLRDPKLVFDDKQRVYLTAYARPVTLQHRSIGAHMKSWFTDSGHTWSSTHNFGEKYWWLWRTRFHKGNFYGLAYNREKEQINLSIGSVRGAMHTVKQGAMSKAQHGLGYPNESDLWFDDNNTLWAIVRRDADTFTAQLGKSEYPYCKWQWHDLGCYVGGPVWVPLVPKYMLVAGRKWDGRKLETQLWILSLDAKSLNPLITLPSAGDNSYPGLVINKDTLYVSYYSSHIDNQSRVYLAELTGIERLIRELDDES